MAGGGSWGCGGLFVGRAGLLGVALGKFFIVCVFILVFIVSAVCGASLLAVLGIMLLAVGVAYAVFTGASLESS